MKGWSVNGTPADCVKLAIEYLLPQKPDLVISGINRGANVGTDVLYSGTVSAAIEATIFGIPAMAVSLTVQDDADFSFAADFIKRILRVICQNNLPKNTLLNINVPGNPARRLPEWLITRLGMRHYGTPFKKGLTLAGEIITGLREAGKNIEYGGTGYRCMGH